MNHPFSACRLLLALFAASLGLCIGTAAPIPANRMPASGWTGHVGVPGGIPTNYTQAYDVTQPMAGYSGALADPTGVADSSPAIQYAVTNCPNNQFVYIPAGNYRLNSAITRQGLNFFDNVQRPYSILIKGAGPANTKLFFYGAGSAINFIPNTFNARRMAIASGNTRGSTSITVTAVDPYLATNLYVVVNRINTEAITDRPLGLPEQSSGYMTNTTSQIVKVTNISGNTLTITPALNEGYASDDISIGISAPFRSGIQDLYIENKTDNGGHNIFFNYAQECWVKNVESNMASKWHIRLQASARCEIRDNYVHDGYNGGGDSIYGVGIFQYSCNNLIENNIAERCRHSFITEYGGQGNVFGYNYSKDPINGDQGANFSGIQGGSPGQLATDYLMGDLIHHGGEPRYNLFEGNVGATIRLDVVLGGSRFATAFRNRITRKGLPSTIVANFGSDIQKWNYYVNLVGNEYEDKPAGAPATLRRWGSDQDTPNQDAQPLATALLDGETEIATATTTWAGADQTLVNSYYLTAKPAWFGTLNWPAFSPATAATSSTVSIPAGFRRINGTPPPTAPYFLGSLANQVVAAGANVTFTAASAQPEGFPAPTYRWQKGGVDLTDGGVVSGSGTATLTLTNVTAGDAGNYSVRASNASGNATSNAAVLTVGTVAPAITTQPAASQTVTVGATVLFTVAASGAPTPTFQWKKNSVDLTNGGIVSGATSATLTLTGVGTSDAGTYTAVASNGVLPAATSNNAVLVVNGVAPTISVPPASQTVLVGAPVTFTVTASGTPTLTYQWKKDTANISGATSSSYTIASPATTDSGSYTVTVTNGFGSLTSAAATLTVNPNTVVVPPSVPLPSITAQPRATSVVSGHNGILRVAATGSTSYQWQVSSDNGATWSNLSDNPNYSGTTSSTLTISNANETMTGYLYRALASNASGSAASNAAALNVFPPVLMSPTDVAVTSAGILLVSDQATNTIQRVGTDGLATALAGFENLPGFNDGTGGLAKFRQPTAGALDGSGNLFVADTGNSLIRRVTPTGVVTTVAGSEANQNFRDGTGPEAWFNLPTGIAVDATGNLFVADTGNSVIRKITPAGVVTTLAGTAGAKGSADGTGPAARFNQPTGLALDASGNLFVADTLNQTIRRITSAGVVSTVAGVPGIVGMDDGPANNALFNHPWGVTLDSSNNLYVSDSGNSTIRRISSTGTVTTLAGLPTVSGLLDGTGLDALLHQPMGLRRDSAGNLYVADNGNAAIRRVSPAGAVTTLIISRTPFVVTPPPLPAIPPLPADPVPTQPTPLPVAPTAPSTGGGGGGGAPSWWFLLALLTLGAARLQLRFSNRMR